MKPFVMLVLFICLCSLYALTAPTNVRATAIGHDAYTLRWDAVDGATGYKIEVLEAVDEYLVDTSFEGLTVFPEGWLSASATVYNYSSFAHGGSYLCTITSNTGFVRLPAFSEPAILKFWIRCSINSSVFTLKIQESHDGVNWLDIKSLQAISGGSGEVTPTYNEFIIPLANPDNQNKYVRFYRSAGTYTPYIDDIRLQNANHHDQTVSYHATRLTDVDPATDYYFRIRATSDLQAGPFSEWQSITTLAEAPATAANGSAINSIPVTITLPQIGTYPQQSIEIAPNIGDGDYLVTVDEPAANTMSYSITAADGELPGSYIIHHPGFTASNLEVLSAQYDAVTLANGSSSLSITSFTGKGTLQILLNLDETLPVQMGRMMLDPVGINGVNLQWFSYSESELAGYYVLRSESNDLNHAQYVSSMIEATNTGSNAHYVFHDTDVSESCYYWLEARDYSGASEFFGPEYYEKLSPGNDTPPILKDTLHAIYPNPFNPSTTISYSLAEPQAISIKIYDARGRLVHRHDEANKSAGRYQYIWNAEGAASGVYFLKLEIGERSFERKLVLLK
jgi:hypothetical protein